VGVEPSIEAVRDCLEMRPGSVQPALGDAELLVLPAPEEGLQIRRVACRVSDPVSTALVDGASVARFPPGWGFSAVDCARQAVAERSAKATEWRAGSERRRIWTLSTAARAAIFDSVAAGDPELPLTVAATAARLGEMRPSRRDAIEACVEHASRTEPDPGGSTEEPGAVLELTEVVEGLIFDAELERAQAEVRL
jgi:hypothetical protein